MNSKAMIRALLLCSGLLALSSAQAAIVTVWNTLPAATFGKTIGDVSTFNQKNGILFTASASGNFFGLVFNGKQDLGSAGWQFSLYSNAAGNTVGSLLESLGPVPVGSFSSNINVSASDTVSLTTGQSYWLFASLAPGNHGVWNATLGTTTTETAVCNTFTLCASYAYVLTDPASPAVVIQVDTAAVPLPASVWLLLSGLLAVALVANRGIRSGFIATS